MIAILNLVFLITLGSTTVGAPRQEDKTEIVDRTYPKTRWARVTDLEASGWSSEALERAKSFAHSFPELAVVVVEKGRIVASFGDIERVTLVQSVRKSLMNALYGISVRDGVIDLDATLEDLDIDDEDPSLSPEERTATVRHLLQSRSGIYRDAATTPSQNVQSRPPRGTHPPGSHWFYNNWDFNALGTIFEQESGEGVFESFRDRIARPIGMQDFGVENCEAFSEDVSIHEAHHFGLSARDMARFGWLYLCRGAWRGEPLLPASWVEESTKAYSGNDREGYGYLWWIQHRLEGFAARGGSAQTIMVVPDRELVFVTQIPRHERRMPSWNDIGRLLSLVLRAKD